MRRWRGRSVSARTIHGGGRHSSRSPRCQTGRSRSPGSCGALALRHYLQRHAMPPATKEPRETITADEIARSKRSSQPCAQQESESEAVTARDAGRLARAAEEQGGAGGRQDGCSVASRPSGAPWGSSRRVRKAALRPKSWPNRGQRPTELPGTDNGAYKVRCRSPARQLSHQAYCVAV